MGTGSTAVIIKVNVMTEKYIAQRINEANKISVDRLMSVEPVVTDVDSALNVIPGMTPHTILHSGPPITWNRMCDPMRRAVKGALILEGLAKDDKSAEKLMKTKKIILSSNHAHGSVGPMTGIISASMPVLVTKDTTFGNTSYSTFNEGRFYGLDRWKRKRLTDCVTCGMNSVLL